MKVFFRVSLAVFFCVLFLATSTIKPAFAQITQGASNYANIETNPDVPKDIHSLSQIVTTEVLATVVCQLSGIDVIKKNQPCLGIDPKTNRIGFIPNSGGLIGLTATGIQFTLNIPIHSSDYIQYMANKFGFEHAYAAASPGGVGFVGLEPLLGIWTAFRNIVYLFFVIIFVLVGIAIMLRVQIDPRTVMTLENQLPKIIIGIILVTFSYAIAGFLVDAMWLVTFLIINVVAGTDPQWAAKLTSVATSTLLQGPLGYVNNIFDHNFNGMGGVLDITGTATHAISDVIHNIIAGTNNQTLFGGDNSDPNASIVNIITGDITHFIVDVIGAFVGGLLGILGGLIILVALFITMFKVWFTLLQAFAYILLDVMLAPFHIAAGLIPGSGVGFGSWLRGVAANLLVFPTTVFMFVMARVLFDAFYGTTTPITGVGGGSLFEPPLIGSFNGGGAGNPLGAFVALSMIFATPSVLNVIKKALQVQDNGLGAAALANMGAGGKTVSGIARKTANLTTAYKIDPLKASASERVWASIFR